MSARDRYGALLARILEHPRYGPAMEEAVARQATLVLNYHSHQGNERFCVSICEKLEGAIEVLDIGLGKLRELVHVEGFGSSREDYLPLCGELARALVSHYGLAKPPLLYLEGEPPQSEAPTQHDSRNGGART